MLCPELNEVAGITGSWTIPFSERARKKRTVFIWTCCSCLTGGMRVSVTNCPSCGLERCSYCQTEKIVVKE
ncbi:hypothetical protein NCS57_00782200 [Fusarium keratoplasticum]|uniref:Uncharacterized protein n=1 Tax=Fusarium keratoplasticum TaxID=1328300 RepID=A0ACC0QZ55_9HYPO|nr:hypothetical protein NCS57_00782200 [Fusarium keratoplasticum]KAI8669665.1 hypothetical protein NCS57_00782200 [Fusarium keratoplasticum]